MGCMKTTAASTPLRSVTDLHESTGAEQLSLLPTRSTPARFQLSRETRERGMRHVAEIRQVLAARSGTDTRHTDRAA